MRLAIISDIHSNIDALQAVYDDILSKEVDIIVSTGDLVGYLPFPNDVVEFFIKYKIQSVQGNHDQFIANSKSCNLNMISGLSISQKQGNASARYTNMTINEVCRSFLKNLPQEIKMKVGDMSILFTHGSPRKIDEYLYEDEELLELISRDLKEDILVIGHTHKPYYRKVNDTHIINAGSVGKSKNGNKGAVYTILEIENKNIEVEFFEVQYDMKRLFQEIRKSEYISDTLITSLTEGI